MKMLNISQIIANITITLSLIIGGGTLYFNYQKGQIQNALNLISIHNQNNFLKLYHQLTQPWYGFNWSKTPINKDEYNILITEIKNSYNKKYGQNRFSIDMVSLFELVDMSIFCANNGLCDKHTIYDYIHRKYDGLYCIYKPEIYNIIDDFGNKSSINNALRFFSSNKLLCQTFEKV